MVVEGNGEITHEAQVSFLAKAITLLRSSVLQKASLLEVFKTLWHHLATERRLPGVITSHAVAVLPLYLWLKLRLKWTALCKPGQVCCVVAFPITQNRYRTYLLFVLQQVYRHILVVWSPGLRDLQGLFPEGRRIFRMKGIYFVNQQGFMRMLPTLKSFDFIRASDGPSAPHEANRIFDINTNLAELACPNSYLFPYGPHPNNFPRSKAETVALAHCEMRRPMRVFFSGQLNPSSDHDHFLIEKIFGVPCRKAILTELKLSYPNAVWIDDQAKRASFDQEDYGRNTSLVVATVKGSPKRWLFELGKVDFFLCLPGSHMLMCHNAVEAISMGCIPILCYENWFSPNLVHGTNCLSYRDLAGLKNAIDTALTMTDDDVAALRSRVTEYYERHLNCINAAKRIFGRQQRHRRLTIYFNQEDCDNYGAAVSNSVLLSGGSLQVDLDTVNQS
jgi:hypothetical protein